MTLTEYTFRIEEDGLSRDVTVPLTFDDLPVGLAARLILIPESERVAELLAYRLDIPVAAAHDILDQLDRGEGIQVT